MRGEGGTNHTLHRPPLNRAPETPTRQAFRKRVNDIIYETIKRAIPGVVNRT